MDSQVLERMWNSQKIFNRNFVDFDHMDFTDRQTMTKEYVLHLLSEANSLLDTVNWKMHHKKNREVNREDLVLEVIDTWKYLLSVCLLWDITPEEFCRAYDEKSALVEQKYLQEFSEVTGREIVICDIDGVLGDYPYSFLEFVENEEKARGRDLSIDKVNVTCLDLYRYLSGKVSSDDLKKYKHEYRSCGLSRKEKVLDGASDFLKSLKDQDYYIVLLTSRPFDKYKCLDLDTHVWLKENGLVFDMLLFDSKKRDKVNDLVNKTKVKFIVEDDPRLVANLVGLSQLEKIYLIDKPYNQEVVKSDKIVRVKSLREVI